VQDLATVLGLSPTADFSAKQVTGIAQQGASFGSPLEMPAEEANGKQPAESSLRNPGHANSKGRGHSVGFAVETEGKHSEKNPKQWNGEKLKVAAGASSH